MTTISRRVAFQLALGGLALPGALKAALADAASSNTASPAKHVKSIDGGECAARIAKIRSLLDGQKVAAILIEAGSSLEYFTGIRWWRSERTTAALIPAGRQADHRHAFLRGSFRSGNPEDRCRHPPLARRPEPLRDHRQVAERSRRPRRLPSSTRPATSSSTTSRKSPASTARLSPAKTWSTPAA